MVNKLVILLAARSRQEVEGIAAALDKEPGFLVNTRIISNGHFDPLHGLTELPDVLILVLGAQWQEEIAALASKPPALRPATIVVGATDDSEIMRMAMRAGVRDFLTHPVEAAELKQTLQHIVEEKESGRVSTQQRMIALLNAKGGSGASLIANSLAYILATKHGKRTALLDFDIQFGAQALYLDLHPDHDVIEAVGAVENLDEFALEGYMTKHKSGLRLLAAPIDRLVLHGEIPNPSLKQLLRIVKKTYNITVIDLPRIIDAMSTATLEQASSIIVVMQQTLAGMRDAKRLNEILQVELEIPKERIILAVNRYNPKHPIDVKDIQNTLQYDSPVLIPNDYKRVEMATNQGIPLYDAAPNAAITQALIQLATQVGGGPVQHRKEGILNRAMSWFSKGTIQH